MTNPARRVRVDVIAGTKRTITIECLGSCRRRGQHARTRHIAQDATLNDEPYTATFCTRCEHLSYTHTKTGSIFTPFEMWRATETPS